MRRPFRVKRWVLLAVVIVCAGAVVPVFMFWRSVEAQKRVAQALMARGIALEYEAYYRSDDDPELPMCSIWPGRSDYIPRWLALMCGEDAFSSIYGAYLMSDSGVPFGDRELASAIGLLKQLPRLGVVKIAASHITDEGLVYLEELPHLRFLLVRPNDRVPMKITEKGLQRLMQKLPELRVWDCGELYVNGRHIKPTVLD